MAEEKNVLLTDNIIAKEILRLLKNNLVFARLVYRDYKRYFGKKVGDSINLKLPYRVKAADGRTLVKQPLVDQTIPFKINKQHHVGLEYTVQDKTLDIDNFSTQFLQSGIVQLANKVDRAIALTIKNIFHTSGTPGVRAGAFIDYANAAAKQTTYAVPNDGMRHAVLDPFSCAALSDEVTKLFKESMVEKSFKMGYQGEVARYKTYESQNMVKHTVGDHGGTPLVAAGTVNGSTIATTGWDVSTTDLLNVGDVFTMDGVFGVNPQNYETTGILQEFVVQAQTDSDAGGLATITVSPALNDGTATTTNEDGDTISLAAYQNITALPATNAPITVQGAAGVTYEQNYLFHRDAIALAVVDLDIPKTAVIKERIYDKDSGLSILMTGAYDITEQSEITRIDIVYGTKAIYPELGLKQWGAVAG